MNPPTKFEIMRRNRSMGAYRAAMAAESSAQVVAKLMSGQRRFNPRDTELFQPAPTPAPAVPTMEIDGVRYREASESDAVAPCLECAFYNTGCHEGKPQWRKAEQAFGGDCIERSVIYLRAD